MAQSLELPGTPCCGVDSDGGIWHLFFAIEPDTVLFEVKPGATDKEFARWVPEEFSCEAAAYLDVLQNR